MKLKAEYYKNFHLFGEMDLNLYDTPKNIYKKACEISEDCGYLTTVSKVKNPTELIKWAKEKNENLNIGKIEIEGEDCPDSVTCTNVLYYSKDGITKIQKVVYKTKWVNKYEGMPNVEPHNEPINTTTQVIEWVEGKWVEVFNLKEHEESLKKDPLYQKALEKEGKTDHPLYTGFREATN